ncbi:MAG: YdcH family protein [Thermoleophilia bacterium]|nr:YdcH family protein [Thermoleophilia bacterium]
MFHEHRDLITRLKNDDLHFRRVFDEHNDLDERITRMDDRIEVASDQEIEQLKRQKLRLKDELYAIIRRHAEA